MPFLPGYVFANRYRLQRYIGWGTFGEVYEALDTHQGDVIALKLLKLINPNRPWAEAEILTQLRSPYVLSVRNADVWAGQPYLATDLARFGAASARMLPLGVSPDLAVRWIRDACRGAVRTHHAGLVHRDIKADNLFLTGEDAAVLGDFGIAEIMNPLGQASNGGTPETMAPEVAAGLTTSVRSDVYSLGASLYGLLAGRFAHQGANPAACQAAVVSGPGPRLRAVAPHVTQALAVRVEKAMARSPAGRYPDAASFDAALGELPLPDRAWRRTDEHAPLHHLCFRGEDRCGGVAATVCAVAVGRRYEVAACHQPSGRRIHAASRPPGPTSALARNLRSAMASVP
jgi:eukaryotic-like serine/threonine-protein kinase